MAKKIAVIYYRAGHPVELCQIEDTLQDMKHLVGGWIEHVSLPNGLHLWCNEEGKIHGLPITAIVCGEPIAGNFFISRANEPDIASVQDGDMDLVLDMIIPVS